MDKLGSAKSDAEPGRPEFVVRFFGPLAVEGRGRTLGPQDLGGRRPKQVLEILLAARGRAVPTDRIADLLWGTTPPQNPAGSIQTFVSVLRRRLSADKERARRLVVTEAEAYRFTAGMIEFDLDQFDELYERSAREPTRAARRSLEQALALVRGEVLEDEPYAVWAQELRGTYQGRVLGAHLDAADAALAELDFAAALARAEAAIGLDRFSDRAFRTAMLALYAVGRQHEALEIYRRFRARLDEELGLEAAPETRALESAILRQEDVCSLLPRPSLRIPGGTVERTVRLLGRTAELDLLERVVRQALDRPFALLQIEGESGMGKTRLLDELATSLVGLRVGRASCSELESHLPYVPLAAALRDALRGVHPDFGQLPALRRVLPELNRNEPTEEFAEIDALEALVELIATQGPMVLLLDDFQWADPQTVAAVSYLQRRAGDVPAALVTAVAAEETPADHAARRLKPAARVHLEALGAAELAPLGIPDLQESTGGNPRFVSVAIANGGRGELSAALAETLLSRCRSEGASSYRVLRAASVLEQPFDAVSLATVLRVDGAELLEELEHLCERRILRVDGFGFCFRYQVVREALRANVSLARQRVLRERLDQLVDRPPTSTERAARAA